jgi:hypothetical protein
MRRGTVSERRGRGTVGTRIGADAALYLERPDKLLGVQFKHGDGDVHEQVRPDSVRCLVRGAAGTIAARRRPGDVDVPEPARGLRRGWRDPGGQRLLLLPLPVTRVSRRRFGPAGRTKKTPNTPVASRSNG